jgi:hypothetical protein
MNTLTDVDALIYRYDGQVQFAADYAPLYAHTFRTLAGWLRAHKTEPDPLVTWLLNASAGRRPFEIPLLLAAGLHRAVLRDASPLTPFFPTTGGTEPYATPRFAAALRRAIERAQDELAAFLQSANVQTNETGRGLIWLLPLLASGWQRIHLLDLGASAGLNLVANARAYQLVDTESNALLRIGTASETQFTISYLSDPSRLPDADATLPTILSRTGIDMRPFVLDSADSEMTLASYVWGDHPTRLLRLREGIAALHAVAHTPAAVRLHPVLLPAELTAFLTQTYAAADGDRDPIVLYNTFITIYLDDRGSSLRNIIGAWAQEQQRPVLWLQWEPQKDAEAPVFGWVGFSADLWQAGQHYYWLLGWVHPHGTPLQLESGWDGFMRFFQQMRPAEES